MLQRQTARQWYEWSLGEELNLLREQGYDPAAFQQEFDVLKQQQDDDKVVPQLLALFDRVQHNPGPRDPDFPYVEPSDYESILAERPAGPRRMQTTIDEEDLRRRLHGAWLGRSAGCLFGNPIEGWTHEQIKRLGKAVGDWPLTDYLPCCDNVPDDLKKYAYDAGILRGNIRQGVRDDDTDYTILGLAIFEEFGPGFTPADVATTWFFRLPYYCACTAERAAYMNLVNYIEPPQSALKHNGFREWIGAWIRADFWGYVSPGWPEKAADYAFRDASISHVANGIYGTMFFSALLSAVLVGESLLQAIQIALSEIPHNCRFAEAIRDSIAIADRHSDWDSAFAEVQEKYGHYSGVHAINNAVYVMLGLLYSDGDFEKGLTLTVMAGADTDCTGATAGSILGAMLTDEQLPDKWVGPLNDTIDSIIYGFPRITLTALTERCITAVRRNLAG